MPKLSDKDFALFHKLSSAYHAVSVSATDPVVLKTGLEKEVEEIFGGIFYDCFENENVAINTMRSRINACSQEIASHYAHHKNMLEVFYTIEEYANTNNRDGVFRGAADLCRTLLSYSQIVRLHHQKLKRSHISPFLSYPACPKGHYFHVQGRKAILQNSFNPTRSLEGLMEEIDGIISLLLLELIIESRHQLRGFKLTDLQDTGEGITDSSLRGRLELTKELLLRVGYVIQPSD